MFKSQLNVTSNVNYLFRFERHLLFGKIYAQTVEDFCMGNCMYNKDNLKSGTARRFVDVLVGHIYQKDLKLKQLAYPIDS